MFTKRSDGFFIWGSVTLDKGNDYGVKFVFLLSGGWENLSEVADLGLEVSLSNTYSAV